MSDHIAPEPLPDADLVAIGRMHWAIGILVMSMGPRIPSLLERLGYRQRAMTLECLQEVTSSMPDDVFAVMLAEPQMLNTVIQSEPKLAETFNSMLDEARMLLPAAQEIALEAVKRVDERNTEADAKIDTEGTPNADALIRDIFGGTS
jgi:hypothetical protein